MCKLEAVLDVLRLVSSVRMLTAAWTQSGGLHNLISDTRPLHNWTQQILWREEIQQPFNLIIRLFYPNVFISILHKEQLIPAALNFPEI